MVAFTQFEMWPKWCRCIYPVATIYHFKPQVKQMQPVQLCLHLCKWHKETYEEWWLKWHHQQTMHAAKNDQNYWMFCWNSYIPSPLWPLSSATCRRCKVWNDIESLSSLTQMLHFMCGHNLWHLPPPLTMIRVPALWLMQGVIFAKEKGGRTKFKATQSVRGGLAGGRHKMWRQKPEEASSRGAPTQLFLTLEHWI